MDSIVRCFSLILLVIFLAACTQQAATPTHTTNTPIVKQADTPAITTTKNNRIKRTTQSKTTTKNFSYQHHLTGSIQDSVVGLQRQCIDQLVRRIQSLHQKMVLDEARVAEKVTVKDVIVDVECRITLTE
jgi:hypothetical protein